MGLDGRHELGLASEPVLKQEGRPRAASEVGSKQLALSPSLHLDRVQVFQQLGSLHEALAEHRPSCNEDSLWRENRRLRGEVQSWKDEAAARHRETAELRLEVAQLHAELQAEQSRSQELFTQLEVSGRRDLAVEGCPGSSSSSFRAEGLVDGLRPKPFSSAAREMPKSDCVEARADAAHGVSLGLAAMSTRHACEVAEMQLQHASALQALQGKADVALGRARLAEVQCTSLEAKKARCLAVMARQAEAHVCYACLSLWRRVCQSARELRRTKLSTVSVFLRAFQERESLPGMVLHGWRAVCLAERTQRKRNELEAELSSRESVHRARLSWLMSYQTSSKLQADAKELFLSWRCLALSAGSSGLHARLRLEEARRNSAQRYLLQQRERQGSKFTLQDVLGAWSQEVLVRRHREVLEQSELARVRHTQASTALSLKWLALLQGSKEEVLLSRAFSALRLEVQERVQQARARALSAQQASELVSCANGRAVQAVLLAMDRSGHSLQRCAFAEWRAAVHAGKTVRSLEDHERTVSALRRHFDCIATGFSRRSLVLRTQGRALIAWARACRQRQLETFRQQEKARSFDFRQKFVEMMCWHGKDCDDHLAFHIWQAWIRFCQLAARDRATEHFVGQLQQLQVSWSKSQILMVGASLQVQLLFLKRACFAAWRRARCLAQASCDQQERQRLHFRTAQLQYSRDSVLQGLARKMEEDAVGFWFRLAWALWRRLRLERMMGEECDIVGRLLVELQERWAQHERLREAQELADQEACSRLELGQEGIRQVLASSGTRLPGIMMAEMAEPAQRLPPPHLCHAAHESLV